MATTIKGLKTALKKANRRVDKAFARYKKAITPLYVNYGGATIPLEIFCFSDGGYLRNLATEISDTFWKRARGGWHGKITLVIADKDDFDACALERAIDAAVGEREKILNQLRDKGYNPYTDAELWK